MATTQGCLSNDWFNISTTTVSDLVPAAPQARRPGFGRARYDPVARTPRDPSVQILIGVRPPVGAATSPLPSGAGLGLTSPSPAGADRRRRGAGAPSTAHPCCLHATRTRPSHRARRLSDAFRCRVPLSPLPSTTSAATTVHCSMLPQEYGAVRLPTLAPPPPPPREDSGCSQTAGDEIPASNIASRSPDTV